MCQKYTKDFHGLTEEVTKTVSSFAYGTHASDAVIHTPLWRFAVSNPYRALSNRFEKSWYSAMMESKLMYCGQCNGPVDLPSCNPNILSTLWSLVILLSPPPGRSLPLLRDLMEKPSGFSLSLLVCPVRQHVSLLRGDSDCDGCGRAGNLHISHKKAMGCLR